MELGAMDDGDGDSSSSTASETKQRIESPNPTSSVESVLSNEKSAQSNIEDLVDAPNNYISRYSKSKGNEFGHDKNSSDSLSPMKVNGVLEKDDMQVDVNTFSQDKDAFNTNATNLRKSNKVRVGSVSFVTNENQNSSSSDEQSSSFTKVSDPVKTAWKVKLKTVGNQVGNNSSLGLGLDDNDGESTSPTQFKGFTNAEAPGRRYTTRRKRKRLLPKKVSKQKNVGKKNPFIFKSKLGKDKKKGNEAQLTEYAQYLGLQPTVKFKCFRCEERGFPTLGLLADHQRTCKVPAGKAGIKVGSQNLPVDTNSSTNFKITRKVYLCSACGTYYENWNLFLHMREVHTRYICLFCLAMYTNAKKLADHLGSTHKIIDTVCESMEEYHSFVKGSSYLMCCICEQVFTDRDDFFDHSCLDKLATNRCKLCNVKGGHFHLCPNNNISHSSVPKSETLEAPVSTKKQTGSKFPSRPLKLSLTKHLVPISNMRGNIFKSSLNISNPVINETLVDCDDDYDISDAASFCHVDIGGGHVESTEENPVLNPKENQSTLTKAKPAIKGFLSELASSCTKDDPVPQESNTEENPVNSSQTISNVLTPLSVELNATSEPIAIDEHEHIVKEKSPLSKEEQNHAENSDGNVESDTSVSEEEVEKEDPRKVMKDNNDSELNLNEKIEEIIPKDSLVSKPLIEEGNNKAEKKEEDVVHPSDIESDDSNKLSMAVEDDANESETEDKTNNSKAESSEIKDIPESAEDTSTESVKNSDTINNDCSKEDDGFKDNDEENDEGIDEEKGEDDSIQLAGEHIAAMALTLDEKVESLNAQSVVKECVRTSCISCVYCRHAVKIAVNGKQLALHLLAEHRYTPVKNDTSDDVVRKLKISLFQLQNMFFNTDSYDSTDKTCNASYDHTFDCFQCLFVTKVHKDLYVHKRKMHQKTILLCIMCKSNFYSYSELLCHMCPGVYVSEEVKFRCCFCDLDEIPSAFRLMVHLRKSHHTCDICLDVNDAQQKLSSHMWKHKLHHLCYRCGIAYRNKPDITKHLFWKHGTESILCKRCLQKKWPHVYHFCIPPSVFTCEECNAHFTKSVALKVHKRIHTGDAPYACEACEQRFVSKKLLHRHEEKHREPKVQEDPVIEPHVASEGGKNSLSEHMPCERSLADENDLRVDDQVILKKAVKQSETTVTKSRKKKNKKEKDKKSKPVVVDVYDLPPLNLSSESDDSGSETRRDHFTAGSDNSPSLQKKDDSYTEINESKVTQLSSNPVVSSPHAVEAEDNQPAVPIIDGIWDNFKTYTAELEKKENTETQSINSLPSQTLFTKKEIDVIMDDHDYCIPPISHPLTVPEPSVTEEVRLQSMIGKPGAREHSSSVDHDYCTSNTEDVIPNTPPPSSTEEKQPEDVPAIVGSSPSKKRQKTPKKKATKENSSSSSDSSSDSNSSSCTCGTNCSCSSSSSNSSSSSSSNSDSSSSGNKHQGARREKKKDRSKSKTKEEAVTVAQAEQIANDEESIIDARAALEEPPIRESELETDETSTDEDFYDSHPQRQANILLAAKKNQLMLLAAVAPVNNGSVSPTPTIHERKPSKRKQKTKRKKKSLSHKKSYNTEREAGSETVTSTPLSQRTFPTAPFHSSITGSDSESENPHKVKRKRVRNKFYGYSSGDGLEDGTQRPMKWRKVESTSAAQPAVTFSSVRESQVSEPEKKSDSSDSEQRKPSSSSSSGSESEVEENLEATHPIEKSENLYCYCQCPYDEVSEMIACDGQSCAIEWFHFECVGIMIPPKGKWFCPDCRKRKDT